MEQASSVLLPQESDARDDGSNKKRIIEDDDVDINEVEDQKQKDKIDVEATMQLKNSDKDGRVVEESGEFLKLSLATHEVTK